MTLGGWKVHAKYKEPLDNREVVLYESDYEIIRNGTPPHSQAHIEIETHAHVVRKAVENPDCVKADSDNKKRKVYYSWYSGGREYPGHHMKVVIDTTWYGTLMIVTAYFTDSFKDGEVTIWDKQNGKYE